MSEDRITALEGKVERHEQLAKKLLAAFESLAKELGSQLGISEKAPICPGHQVEMIKRHGRNGDFWSCNQRNDDGTWCRYRPPSS